NATQRQRDDGAGDFHAGQRVHSFYQLMVKGGDAAAVIGSWRIDAQRQRVVGIEAQPDLLQTQKAAHHQPRACQQDQSERYLRHDQQAPQPIAASARYAAPALFERLYQINTRGLPRGRRAEDQARQQRDGERERQHAAVQVEFHPERQFERERGQQQI